MTEIRRRDATSPAPAPARAGEANPLRALPREWRKPVRFFYAAYSDVLKAPIGVVALLRMWQRDDGLTVEECRDIFRRLLRPEEVGRVQYAGQLIARLGQLVEQAVRDRRRREQAAADRHGADRDRAFAAPAAEIKQQLAARFGIGGGP